MKKLIASALALLAAGMVSAQVHFGIGARGEFGFGLGSALSGDLIIDSDNYKQTTQPFKSFLAGGALIGRLSFDAVPGLFIQPEVGFSHNRLGYKTEYSHTSTRTRLGTYNSTTGTWNRYTEKEVTEWESESSIAYNSIDFPILVGYDFEVGSGMVVSPFAGLSLSVPVGSFSTSSGKRSGDVITYHDGNQVSKVPVKDDDDDGSSSIDVKTALNPGAIFGVGFGYKFDQHNMIMGDLRYLLDFIPTKGEVDFLGTKLDWDIMTRRGLKLGFNYVYMF